MPRTEGDEVCGAEVGGMTSVIASTSAWSPAATVKSRSYLPGYVAQEAGSA